MYNGNMKNQLPRKYRIICRVGKAECAHHIGVRNVGRLYQADNDNHRRVHRLDAPENLASLRYVGMHNGFADDSRRVRRSDAPENIASPRDAGMHNRFADDSCRVRRSDAPENLASSRYAERCYGDADDTKTAETLALSGFAGGGGAPI